MLIYYITFNFRTSNAEIDFQKSLLKATELSKTVTNSNKNDCIQIDDSDEEEVLNIIKKKPLNVQKTNVFASGKYIIS